MPPSERKQQTTGWLACHTRQTRPSQGKINREGANLHAFIYFISINNLSDRKVTSGQEVDPFEQRWHDHGRRGEK